MSLFPPCQWKDCDRIAASECPGLSRTMRLCAPHAGEFITREEQASASALMICELTEDEKISLGEVYQLLPFLTSELTMVYVQHHQQRMQSLLAQIQEEECALLKQLKTIQELQKLHAVHLIELINRKQLPLMTPDGVIPVLVELKLDNDLNCFEVTQSILAHLMDHSSKHLLDEIDEVTLCKKCGHIGLKREVHQDCSVCNTCIDTVSVTPEKECEACRLSVCDGCTKGTDDTESFKCSKNCLVCHQCWRDKLGRTGACPVCKTRQDEAAVQQLLLRLGINSQRAASFLDFFRF